MQTTHFNFQNLSVYRKALSVSNQVYGVTKSWPREYLFDITSQFRRAALSIPLNIAEGTSRTKKDFSHFLDIARGSSYECVALIEMASALSLLSEGTRNHLLIDLEEVSRMIAGLKKSMKGGTEN